MFILPDLQSSYSSSQPSSHLFASPRRKSESPAYIPLFLCHLFPPIAKPLFPKITQEDSISKQEWRPQEIHSSGLSLGSSRRCLQYMPFFQLSDLSMRQVCFWNWWWISNWNLRIYCSPGWVVFMLLQDGNHKSRRSTYLSELAWALSFKLLFMDVNSIHFVGTVLGW